MDETGAARRGWFDHDIDIAPTRPTRRSRHKTVKSPAKAAVWIWAPNRELIGGGGAAPAPRARAGVCVVSGLALKTSLNELLTLTLTAADLAA